MHLWSWMVEVLWKESQRRIEAWRNGATVEVKCEIGLFGVVGYETQLGWRDVDST